MQKVQNELYRSICQKVQKECDVFKLFSVISALALTLLEIFYSLVRLDLKYLKFYILNPKKSSKIYQQQNNDLTKEATLKF